MATLSSASTDAEVEAAYDDNGSFEEDGSLAKAKAFVTACRLLIRRAASSGTAPSGHSFSQDVGRLERELDRARAWLIVNTDAEDGGAGVVHTSLEGYRR